MVKWFALATALCAGCLATPSRPAPRELLGFDDFDYTLGCIDPHPQGTAEASSFVAQRTGSVTSLAIDYGGGGASTLMLALYSDADHQHPHALLDYGTYAPGSVIAQGRIAVELASRPSLAAGTPYWIAALCPESDTGGCGFRYLYSPTGSPNCSGGQTTCDTSTGFCTEHSIEGQSVPPAQWVPDQVFPDAVNAFFAFD